jgi:hypothetical protein
VFSIRTDAGRCPAAPELAPGETTSRLTELLAMLDDFDAEFAIVDARPSAAQRFEQQDGELETPE